MRTARPAALFWTYGEDAGKTKKFLVDVRILNGIFCSFPCRWSFGVRFFSKDYVGVFIPDRRAYNILICLEGFGAQTLFCKILLRLLQICRFQDARLYSRKEAFPQHIFYSSSSSSSTTVCGFWPPQQSSSFSLSASPVLIFIIFRSFSWHFSQRLLGINLGLVSVCWFCDILRISASVHSV